MTVGKRGHHTAIFDQARFRRIEPVLRGEAIRHAARCREIAAGILAERDRPGDRVLVEPIGGVRPVHNVVRRPGIDIIRADPVADLSSGGT